MTVHSMADGRAEGKARPLAPKTREEWELWLEWRSSLPRDVYESDGIPEPHARHWNDTLRTWREEGRSADQDDGVVFLSSVARTYVRWLWEPRIPYGKLTVFEGDPENGKSTASLAIAAAQSSGSGLPGGDGDLEPGKVLLLVPEDGIGDTVVPKLEAYGADTRNVLTMGLPTTAEGHVKPLAIPEDLDRLEGVVRRHDVRLVVIDPITAILDESINTNSDASVRKALTPLSTIAERYDCAILLIRHLNKSGDMKALYRGGGSIAFTGAARSVLVFDRHPDDRDRFVMARVKNNLAAVVPAQMFRMVKAHGVVRVMWDGDVMMDADQLLSAHDGRKDAPARKEAEQFLVDVLGNGPMDTNEIRKLCTKAGLSWTTIKRAKANLGVRSRSIKKPDNTFDHWQWKLPEEKP